MDIVSTYRLQFHKGFTFSDGAAIVPYLHELGITHVYASPYLKAVAGSTHGYDVVDQSRLNPEIGSEADYQLFIDALRDAGMSHILDTVPNHMGVDTNENAWWNDVLANGRDSKFANYFDIGWDGFSPRTELHGKMLLPVLGDTYSQTLAKGDLKLVTEDGKPFIAYFNRRFPIAPDSNLQADLNELLENQHYRLSSWRVAADEINYRRFFDITSLAGLQMQRQEVFDAAHDFTFSLIAKGYVAGLRVDHPDGLLDPGQYFQRLQDKFKTACPQRVKEERLLFVSVEKILNGNEMLCNDWPVAGTSGYDFLYAVNDLFVDFGNEPSMTRIYEQFTQDQCTYADWVYRNKCAVLDTSMHSELATLTNRLDALAQSAISSRDFTRRQLQEALRQVIACFSVYRSYVCSAAVSEFDIRMVTQAVDQAAVRAPSLADSILEFIRDSVLLRYPVPDGARSRQLDFAQQFQQLTSPVNAKGIEDTTFYIYNRLTSLNEVGGDPGRFGRDPQAIHDYFLHRQAHWPLSISTLSTHDTKRSEDVRARLNVLSEIPDQWQTRVSRWRELNAPLCGPVHPADQYLLYQTLLGAWPVEPMEAEARSTFIKRICAYMQKALREAKLRTSWTDPKQEYESALSGLVESLIELQNAAFLDDFTRFQKTISYLGMLNSLSQTVIKLCAPGICDTYQGSELWDFSLVDPDNRRPVDYEARRSALASLDDPRSLIESMENGQIKLWVHQKLLQLRRALPDLFLKGSYEPIMPTGSESSRVFCFARQWRDQRIIVVAPRLIAALMQEGRWDSSRFGDTRIAPAGTDSFVSFENVLRCVNVDTGDQRELWLSDLLKDFPVAVLRQIVPSM